MYVCARHGLSFRGMACAWQDEKEMNLKHENTIVHAENNKSEISRSPSMTA